MCVILEKNDEGLVLGRIKFILIHNATAIYFVTEKSQSVCLIDLLPHRKFKPISALIIKVY